MNELAFFQKREPAWKRIRILCDKADLSPANLSSPEIDELFRLYKGVSDDLAWSQTKSHNPELAEFLNDLCARAYAILYRSRGRGLRAGLVDAIELTARTVRKRAWFVGASAALFVGAAVFAYFAMSAVPETRDYFVPEQFAAVFEDWKSGRMQERRASESVQATLFYANNNPIVSIITGAVAASTFGVYTAQLVFTNGAMLGALANEVAPAGRLGYLFTHVMPHGVTELSGIVISGSAGFVMGWALLNPGRKRRADALREAGKDAIVMLAASVVLMLIAAPIEGFFSFNPIVPDLAKIGLAALSAAGWGVFWVGYGRG